MPCSNEYSGWIVHTAICREGDDILKIPPKDRIDRSMMDAQKRFLHIPIKAKFLVAIIKDAVADSPGITYRSIQEIIKPYPKEYMLMDSIVQDARDLAKLQLFESAKEIQYAQGVIDHVRGLGHKVKMIFQDQQEILQLVSAVVLYEDLMRWKKMKLPALDKRSQLKYVNKWKAENEVWLNNVFGLEDDPQVLFLTGFATSSSKHFVPLLSCSRWCSLFIWQVHTDFGSDPRGPAVGKALQRRGRCGRKGMATQFARGNRLGNGGGGIG